MGRAAARVLAAAVLMARAMEVTVLIPASRSTNTIKVIKVVINKVIKVVTINNPAKGVSNNNSSDIKLNLSS